MSVFSWWNNVLDELVARTSGAQAKAEHESQRQWRNMAEDERWQAAWNSIHEAAREPARGDALEAEAWAERNAYWSGNIGQIEDRAMTARERLEWEIARKREECEAAIAHEIEVMVGLGCSPDLAKATVWAGDGNDMGAVAKLGKEFHALERELAALVQETAVEPAQAPKAVVEHDGLDAARELLGVQAREAVAEARPAAPDVIPDFEQTPVVMTEGVHGNGWRYGLAPGRVNAPVASPEAEAAEVRRTSLVAWEQAEQMRLDQKAQVKAGLEEIQQQAAVGPPSAGEEAVTGAPGWEADQQHAMAMLSGLQQIADREGWEPEPEAPAAASVVDILDELGATVSEMTPEERATFLTDDGIPNSGVRWRLADPAHEPILGPGATITGEGLRAEAVQAEAEVQARLHSEIEAAEKVRMAEIEGRDEVARQWAEWDASPMTPDPAAVAEVASRTRENDQLKAEQARHQGDARRPRTREAAEELHL